MSQKKKPEVNQNPALNEIESKLNVKKMEFKQLQENERILKSQLEQTQHDIIKTAGAYTALVDLKKTLLLKEGYEQEKKELTPKQKQTIKKNIAKIKPEVMKTIEKASQKIEIKGITKPQKPSKQPKPPTLGKKK